MCYVPWDWGSIVHAFKIKTNYSINWAFCFTSVNSSTNSTTTCTTYTYSCCWFGSTVDQWFPTGGVRRDIWLPRGPGPKLKLHKCGHGTRLGAHMGNQSEPYVLYRWRYNTGVSILLFSLKEVLQQRPLRQRSVEAFDAPSFQNWRWHLFATNAHGAPEQHTS